MLKAAGYDIDNASAKYQVQSDNMVIDLGPLKPIEVSWMMNMKNVDQDLVSDGANGFQGIEPDLAYRLKLDGDLLCLGLLKVFGFKPVQNETVQYKLIWKAR